MSSDFTIFREDGERDGGDNDVDPAEEHVGCRVAVGNINLDGEVVDENAGNSHLLSVDLDGQKTINREAAPQEVLWHGPHHKGEEQKS